MKEVFKKAIVDFQQRELKHIFRREYDIPLESKKIVSLIGVRRCGKTYILFDLINRLKSKVSPQNIIYINFEDDRLFGVSLNDLDGLIEGYYELFPQKREERVYIFLDEVQSVPHWEQFVRRIYDTLNLSIYITGSSSKLLSSEIATSLRGRTLTYEIFPFSFKEYLGKKEIKTNLYSSKSLSFIKHHLEEYLQKGGFPEILDESVDIQKRILSDYVDLIIYKDIIERYGVTNIALLKHIIRYSFTNISTLVSLTKMFNDFKSQGFKLSKDTLFEYFSHLGDAYALFSVPVFRDSVKEEQRNPKKIYAVDTGFKYIFDTSLSTDFSKLYENAVFLELRRRTKEVYYLKRVQEVDFYAVIDGKKLIINASYEIDSKNTFDREIRALVEAMRYIDVDRAYLVTKEKKETLKIEDKTIEVVPLYEWLLSFDEFN